MKQIREAIFETNSSSTHVLSVTRSDKPYNLPKVIKLDSQSYEFGWQHETYTYPDEKLAYLLLCCENDEHATAIKALLSAVNVQVEGDVCEDYNNSNWSYVDHSNDAKPFVEHLIKHPDLLYAFIFNPASFIETGNDNSDELSDKYPGSWGIDICAVPGDYTYLKGN